MRNKSRIILAVSLFLIAVILLVFFLRNNDIAILNPAGTVAEKQKNLLVFATLLGMTVIVPVFVMTILFAWKYRASNNKADYKPEWSSNHWLEAVWWGIPIIIILILSVVTWRSSHSLDPYKPLQSDKSPITIQVVAMQWKWLFIYPEQNIATVNLVQFPEDTPINFEITADAPMNSFWIPKLGGQIYAMNGMVTKLHLEASDQGEYQGSSANISGEGFSGMKFVAKATSQTDFDDWVRSVKHSGSSLTIDGYKQLAKPSKNHPVTMYSSRSAELYDTIVMKYMGHGTLYGDMSNDKKEGGEHDVHHY